MLRNAHTTPHIIHDYYPNGSDTIMPALKLVRDAIKAAGLDIELNAAAEYFLDEVFMESIDQNKPLLTFSGKYLLFETPFLNEPVYLRDVIFKLHSNGYKAVLAHPERYQYLFGNWNKVEDLYNTGVLFQVNALSFIGHYNKGAQVLAEGLVERGMVHFIGTDCHKPRHLESMKLLAKSKWYKKALEMPLLNHQI
jgi:tyrosine-protein phosphatase YwqE